MTMNLDYHLILCYKPMCNNKASLFLVESIIILIIIIIIIIR